MPAAVDTDPAKTSHARACLARVGAEALSLPATSALTDVIAAAADAPRSPELRAFAVLVVRALAADGLVPVRGGAERTLHRFLESALLNPLRRAAYPFSGSLYDKRQALKALHATIDEHLRPLEPTFPNWTGRSH